MKTPNWKPRILKNDEPQAGDMLKLVDFDHLFKLHLSAWFEDNQNNYSSMDEMEADMPEEYLRWLKKPHTQLNGLAPQEYFHHLSPAALLQQVLCYLEADIPLPDPLIDRIIELRDPEPLYQIMRTDDEQIRILCVNLLEEMQAKPPVDLYIQWIRDMQPGDEAADAAADKLCDPQVMDTAIQPLLEALKDAPTLQSQDCLLDVLSHYPFNPLVLQRLLRSFDLRREKAALYASMLGRYGQESVIPVLVAALDWRDINYLDYIEIRNAVEALGGTVRHQRDFYGDPYYETLKNIQETEV